MMAYAVHLMANAVHPSEAPDVHDGLCSTLNGKSRHLLANGAHPSKASDVHDGICSTPVAKYSTPSEAPKLHDGLCSALDGKSSAPAGKCSTPKRGS